VRGVRSFVDDAELRRHLRELHLDPRDAALSGGQHLSPERLESFREASGIRRVFDYRSGLPWYDSQTGHGIQLFLAAPVAQRLVHVDGDPSGRCNLLVVEAATPGSTGSTHPPRDRRNA
jgi:hypothetical protein